MRYLIVLLLTTTNTAYSQTVNNAVVNLQGINQGISITQSGSSHSATINLNGNNITAIISQSGNFPQSFSLSVSCGNNCPTNPYMVNQY